MVETGTQLRDRVVAAIEDDIDGFELKFKDLDPLHARITRIVERLPLPEKGVVKTFWRNWMRFNTSIYPRVWVDSSIEWNFGAREKAAVLQHEWVHLRDGESFYGLLPRSLRRLNIVLFSIAYASPQLFALGALLAPLAWVLGAPASHWWFLLMLLFLAPIPSPGRAIAELRAYRRSVELGAAPERVVEHFVGQTYWWMLPFRGLVLRLLRKPSPYRDEMNAVWCEGGSVPR